MSWVYLVLALGLMPVAGFAVLTIYRAAERAAESRRKAPPPESLGKLDADLRRLRAELEDTETRAGLTAKHHRVVAVRGAYLDALATACQRVGATPPPGGARASQADIYRAEAELRKHGLLTREPASRADATR